MVPLRDVAVQAELVGVDSRGEVAFREVRAHAKAAMPAEAGTPSDTASEAGPPSDVAAGAVRSIRFEELVRWGNPAAPRPQIVVVLADGGTLVAAAAWAGGAPVRLERESVVALSDTFGEVRLPRALVSGIVFAQRSDSGKRMQLVHAVRAASSQAVGAADVVMLTNADRVSGAVKELAGGSLVFESTADQVKLPLSRVEAIVFGDSRPTPDIRRRAKVAVGLRDGTLLYADRIVATENELALALADGVTLGGGAIEDVAFLQALGGVFVYLSDLEHADYRHVPYLTIDWPYQRDRSVEGGPLIVRGCRYLKGLGMHSASRLTYPLNGQYQRFDASVALDDSAGDKGSVAFGVYLLRDGAWQEAFASGVVRGGEEPRPVTVDLRGAEGLTLTVDFADRGDELDRAVWLDARVVKE
jgi:hypothetical protein